MSPPRVQSGLIGADALRSPGLWIRVSEAVLATLVWALVADNAGYSYAIFLGVTTGVLCALCVASELRHWGTWLPRRAVLALDCIYWILWLSCAAALSATLTQRSQIQGAARARLRGATALAWMTWGLYWGSVGLDVSLVNAGALEALPNPIVSHVGGATLCTPTWAGCPQSGPVGALMTAV